MNVENFDSFPNLEMLEWGGSYNPVSIDHLINDSFDESTYIVKFLSACAFGQDSEIDWQNLLTVKASDGVCEAIYSPAIWRQDDKLVLQSGGNTFVCKQYERNQIICGNMIGELFGKAIEITAIDGRKINYYKPLVKFRDPQDEEGDEFIIQVMTLKRDEAIAQRLIGDNEHIDYPMLATLSRKGESIAHLIAPPPGGGFKKLTELQIGEYQLLSFVRSVGDFGPQYRLRLADGQTVMSNKRLTELLDARGKMLSQGPMCLKIVKIERMKNGKMSATATILPKLPYQTNSEVAQIEALHQLPPERIRVAIPAAGAVEVEPVAVSTELIPL